MSSAHFLDIPRVYGEVPVICDDVTFGSTQKLTIRIESLLLLN
jgi:hypothetical protein